MQCDIFPSEVLIKAIMKRTVLITGGTGALGTVVARRFIRGGANVAVSYISRQELQRRSPMVYAFQSSADCRKGAWA